MGNDAPKRRKILLREINKAREYPREKRIEVEVALRRELMTVPVK